MKNNVENLNLNREEDRIIDQQLLVMMIGIPGSGKSFFARQLTEKLNAERLNMDLLRRELFGTQNRWEYKELIKGEDLIVSPPRRKPEKLSMKNLNRL